MLSGVSRGHNGILGISIDEYYSERDFSSAHEVQQQVVMEQLGRGGRLAVVIGVAGSGKSALLAALVDAWRHKGRQVYGAALAWEQTDHPVGAGIMIKDRLKTRELICLSPKSGP